MATVELDGAGNCADSRIVLFGVGSTPIRAHAAEAALRGGKPGEGLFADVAKKASEDLEEPLSDVHASSEYRRDLARVLIRRALVEASARAAGGS